MKLHIEKAKNNEDFISLIEKNSNGDFEDWKITVCFYSALHYIKAFLKKRRVTVGFSHSEIDVYINFKNGRAALPELIYNSYQELYRSSRNARYTVVYMSNFQRALLKVSSDEAKVHLQTLKKHLKEVEKLEI